MNMFPKRGWGGENRNTPTVGCCLIRYDTDTLLLEIVAFDILFIGCVLNTQIGYTTAEKLTFEAFYRLIRYDTDTLL